MARRVENQRLASVGYVWAFSALTASAEQQRAPESQSVMGNQR